MDQLYRDDEMILDDVSCPFTWGMERVVESSEWLLISQVEKTHEALQDMEDEFPETMLMFQLMMVYEQVLSNDFSSVEATFEAAKKVLDVIIENRSTSESMRVGLKHIFIGTKCYAYKKLNCAGDIKMLLKEIRSEKYMTKKELAVVYGCRSEAWSLYHHSYVGESVLFAERAVECEPDNGKWHFLLGKCTRRQRRNRISSGLGPDLIERRAFEMAWNLSKNSFFGVYLAQMYRETGNYYKASNIYIRVFELNPTSCKVHLKLALGFIRAKQFAHAKKCLDYVAEKMPNSKTYLHYMAIYHQKYTKDMKAACFFFQRTTENRNYAAEMDYVRCRKMVDPSFEPLPYLLNLLQKYDNESKIILQEINVAIGSCHLFHKNDIVSACKYYIEVMKIDPKNRALTMHRFFVPGGRPINIYEVLIPKVESASQNISGNYDSHQLALFEEIREMCLEHAPRPDKSNLSTIKGSWRNVKSNSRSAGISQTVKNQAKCTS